MPQKKHKPEEIVAKLRQVDVLVSQGQSVAEAVRSISVTQFTYYRWRKEFGGVGKRPAPRVSSRFSRIVRDCVMKMPSMHSVGTRPRQLSVSRSCCLDSRHPTSCR